VDGDGETEGGTVLSEGDVEGSALSDGEGAMLGDAEVEACSQYAVQVTEFELPALSSTVMTNDVSVSTIKVPVPLVAVAMPEWASEAV